MGVPFRKGFALRTFLRMKLTDIVDMKKGKWSPEEDEKLIDYINKYGIWNWSYMPKAAGLSRSGKSCRLRWMNYLRPDLKRDRFSMEEIDTIIMMHETMGNKWSKIAEKLPGRTDNEIKNFWHTHARKFLESNPTVTRANHYRPKRFKRKETTRAKSSHSYGAEESNSSTITESTQFHIIESYSPRDNFDAAFAGNDTSSEIDENFFSGQFCREGMHAAEMIFYSTILEEASSPYPAHECSIQEFAHDCNDDELTSFWFNMFLEANQPFS